MNTTRLHPPLRTLISRVLFAGFALITPLLYAQTFAGRAFLTESPVSLRAIVDPNAYIIAIKVRLENLSTDAVRIRITNEKRETVYDNVVSKSRYIG